MFDHISLHRSIYNYVLTKASVCFPIERTFVRSIMIAKGKLTPIVKVNYTVTYNIVCVYIGVVVGSGGASFQYSQCQ